MLYVETDYFSASLVRATLEETGVTVDWTPCGRSALRAAATCKYDAYVLGSGPHSANHSGLAEELASLEPDVRFVFLGHSPESSDYLETLDVRRVRNPFTSGALVDTLDG